MRCISLSRVWRTFASDLGRSAAVAVLSLLVGATPVAASGSSTPRQLAALNGFAAPSDAPRIGEPSLGVGGGGGGGDAIAGTVRRSPDFDGDGFADLAIGSRSEDVGRRENAGGVNVIYGSSRGLTAAGNQFWSQDTRGIRDELEARDHFGWALAAADFDRDGFSDLAIGVPFEDLSGRKDAGGVNVIYGSARGLTATGNQFWTQGSSGILGASEGDDQLGWSLAAGDFDRDGFADLAIGVKFEDLGSQEDAGGVHVIYGSPRGLTATGNEFWNQGSPGMPDSPETNDQFGRTMAAGDYDGDGFDDLAVGAPYERFHDHRDGRLHVIHGSRNGLTASGNQSWSQDDPGVSDRAELRDQFGIALAAADFDRDGFDDLAISVTFEDFRFIGNEGAVHVIYGSSRGLSARREQFWNQGSPGISDRPEQGDEFGQSLAAADYDGDRFDDLAIGVPREDHSSDVHSDPGAFHVIYGSSRGLTATGDQFFTQDTRGIADSAQRNDHFAEAIAGSDFDGDGRDDLAVGVPWEDIGGRSDAGAVHAIYGSSRGLTTAGAQFWNQDSRGIGRAATANDQFGWSLSAERPAAGTPRLLAP